MKILVITNLFPNTKEPTRGMYNKQEISELSKLCELQVIAPVPWSLPVKISKKWSLFSEISLKETANGIETFHTRYFMIPKFARSIYGFLFFLSLIRKIKKIYGDFKFDLIYAIWAYPDGFGSFLISKVMKKPILIKCLGSDINIYTKYFLRRKMIARALKGSDGVISVSNALKNKIVEIGVPEDKITVIPNGVDTEMFKPLNQVECRKKLGLALDKKIILYVGNFVQIKGVDILINAFNELIKLRSNILLVLVGNGPLEKMLCKKVKALGIEHNVIFTGRVIHNSMRYYMNACDLFCLPSLNEGCPNVILEALACARPVVATRVGGVGELIRGDNTGILVEPDNAKALANALKSAIDKKWDYNAIKNESSRYSWADNATQILKIMESELSK